ncbi:hypothetical protein [uncultured Flavobacterium sp.]|uniref:hypothetical protein n=1 Tax=uncultured Flavobacterium sp. TaxID=165435 RepID=UPI0030CA5206
MEKTPNNSNLKTVVIVLSLLLLASVGYIFKMSSDNKTEVQKNEVKFQTEVHEKESVIKNLEEMSAKYDEEIASNTSLKEELIAERAKIVALISRVKNGEAYKDDYVKLKREMDSLIAENSKLKEENQTLTTNLDNTTTELIVSKKFSDTLLNQNDKLSKTVEKAQKLVIVNLKTIAVKERKSGKQIETAKASRANKLKISFTIPQNAVAKPGEREYYVQVIDAANNVLGDKKSVTIDGKLLTYSFITTVKFNNKTLTVLEELSGDDFKKGTYMINVFNKSDLVANSSFDLK